MENRSRVKTLMDLSTTSRTPGSMRLPWAELLQQVRREGEEFRVEATVEAPQVLE
jgi:hypothetical protein